MIYHQTKYGHTIIMPSEVYYTISDEELREIEERYINVDSREIRYCGSGRSDIDNFFNDRPSKDKFFSYEDED